MLLLLVVANYESFTKFVVYIDNVYWKAKTNRREFLENFAKTHNFDPYVAENWYNVLKTDIIKSVRENSYLYLCTVISTEQILQSNIIIIYKLYITHREGTVY